MENKHLLTTFDNPYNPFVDFDHWFMFDCEMQHNTCGRIARLVDDDPEMTEHEAREERERVMDFIVTYDLEGKFFKGTKDEIQKWIDLNFKKEKSAENQVEAVAEA